MVGGNVEQGSSPEISILVVDQDVVSLREIRAVLDSAGYRTRAAQNGLEALEAACSAPPDMVLLKRFLPDADGLEICRRFKRDGSVRVVLMFGEETSSDDIADGLEAGARAHLAKPFGKRELLARVRIEVEDRIRQRRFEDRKRLENDLAQARNFLETVLELSPVPMWVGDAEGTLIRTNQALRDQVRATDEQLVGIYHPLKDPNVERAGLTEKIRRVLEDHKPSRFSMWWRPDEYWGEDHGEARERCMDLAMYPILKDGKLQSVVTQWFDITEQKHLEEQLRESEEKLRRIIENSSIVFYSHGRDHVLTYVSPQVKDILGYEVDEALIRWTELATDHPANTQAFNVTEKAIQTGEPQPVYELQLRHKDGRLLWIEARESPAVENGKTVAIVGSLTDITARKAVEDALRESEERQTLATRSVGIGIWDWDVATNRIKWDKQMFQLYGETDISEEVSYEYWLERLHPEDVDAAVAEVEAALRGEGELNSEFRVVWPNGTVRWIKGMAVVFQDDAGKPIRMIGTNYDISESKRIEEELRLANQSKDEFLSVMSHDLRSPLNPILGFTSLLLDDASEQEAEMLRHIQSSGQRMLSLVDSLLEYARLDRSAVTPSMRRFNLLKTCSSVFTEVSNLQSDLEGNLNNGGAGLLPLDEGLEVVSDPDIAARILVNLLQNAYKYTKQGHVTLTVGQKSDKGEFCFIIEDTGIGIDNAMIPALFEPFRQADSSYRRSQSGVGLGLAICNKLVGLLGGSISVSSELGVGSCFTLSFPMEVVKVGDSARENCHEPSQIKLQLTKALRVLLVDDQESNSLMAQIMVNRLGGKTTIASGGKEAIDLCEKELFDVILMDLQMPHLDGFQTSEHIRQEGGLNAKTPIFAVTANVSEENERKCLEIGMSGFLRKPITIEEIFDALSEFS